MTTLSKSSPSIPPWLGGGLPGLVRAAVRRGLTIGCVVTIGAVPGIVIGYNIARHGAFPGARFPLLIETDFGAGKFALDEVARIEAH